MVELDPAMILVLDAGFGGSDEAEVKQLSDGQGKKPAWWTTYVARGVETRR